MKIYPMLRDQIDQALENAATLRQQALTPWEEYPNPSTLVPSLIAQIKREKDNKP